MDDIRELTEKQRRALLEDATWHLERQMFPPRPKYRMEGMLLVEQHEGTPYGLEYWLRKEKP